MFFAHFALSYDRAGDVTSRTEEVAAFAGGLTPGSGTWTYGYDGAGRMTSATDPSDTTTTYAYDNAGNRTRVKVGSALAVTTTYDEAGLATSSSDGTSYTNDATGNLIGVDSTDDSKDRCFFYDAFGNQRSANLGSTSGCDWQTGDLKFSYDGLDRLTQGSRGLQFYSGTSQDLASTSSPSTLYYSYAFGPYGDHRGNMFITDLHGDVVGSYDFDSAQIEGSKLYSPWGEITARTGAEVPRGSASPLGFQGQATDADTGFVDMQTRLYDPAQGRFTTRDSLFGDTKSPASMNQYGYVEGNPVTTSDPSGMSPRCSQWGDHAALDVSIKACIDVGNQAGDDVFATAQAYYTGPSKRFVGVRVWARVSAQIGNARPVDLITVSTWFTSAGSVGSPLTVSTPPFNSPATCAGQNIHLYTGLARAQVTLTTGTLGATRWRHHTEGTC